MIDLEPIDNRPYPRTEPCHCCGATPIDVVGPGDFWAMCPACHLALAEEVRREFEVYSWCGTLTMTPAEKHAVVVMADPDASDDAIADAVIAARRDRRLEDRHGDR